MMPITVLSKAADLIQHDRQNTYGSNVTNHTRIAALWSVILKQHVRPDQVAACMVALKLARLVETPMHEDSWIDAAAYAALGHELALDALTDESRENDV